MSHHRSIEDRIMQEMNEQAEAEGTRSRKAFWEIEGKSGSVFDVPDTEKSQHDLAWLQARRKKRERLNNRSSAILGEALVDTRNAFGNIIDIKPTHGEEGAFFEEGVEG